MNCPLCGSDTTVSDTRPREDNAIRRRRICIKCGNRFTTHEREVVEDPIEMARLLAGLSLPSLLRLIAKTVLETLPEEKGDKIDGYNDNGRDQP